MVIYQASKSTWWTQWFHYHFIIKTDVSETYCGVNGSVVETTDGESMDDDPSLKVSKFEVQDD